MNKISKGKAVGLLSLGLASVALGSVGFASWIVSGTTITGEPNVAVTVAGVTDKRVTVSAAVDSADSSVVFDADSTVEAGTLGITASSGAKEDLTFAVKVTTQTTTNYDGGAIHFQFTVALPGSLTNPDTYVYVDTVNNGTGDINAADFTITPTSTEVTTTYTFTMKWGEKFGGDNPVKLNKGQADVSNIMTYLGELQTAMNEKQIVVTLSEVTPAP